MIGFLGEMPQCPLAASSYVPFGFIGGQVLNLEHVTYLVGGDTSDGEAVTSLIAGHSAEGVNGAVNVAGEDVVAHIPRRQRTFGPRKAYPHVFDGDTRMQ